VLGIHILFGLLSGDKKTTAIKTIHKTKKKCPFQSEFVSKEILSNIITFGFAPY
jgi:hypothetical protein